MTLRLSLAPIPPLNALERQWRALEAQSAATAFLRWSWVSARLKAATVPVLLLQLFEGDALVGLAFATIHRVRRKGLLPSRILYLNDFGDPAHDIACVEYNDLLLPAGREAELRQAGFAALAALATPPFDAISIRSCLAEVAHALTATGLSPLIEGSASCAAIDLAAVRAGGSVLALVSANSRQQIRRAMRLYEEQGPLRCQRAETLTEALNWLDALALLHARRWNRSDLIATPYRQMLENLIRVGLADGSVEVVRIQAGTSILGYFVNLIDPGGVRFYLGALAYDTDARLKPGLVAHALCAQHHADAGQPLYDFLAGEARYKTQLGEPSAPMQSLLFRRDRLGFHMEDALRRLKRRFKSAQLIAPQAMTPEK
jgi:CelD/BcsL family acetyltransferase involved in cellulose biosynthesis